MFPALNNIFSPFSLYSPLICYIICAYKYKYTYKYNYNYLGVQQDRISLSEADLRTEG